MNPAALLLRRLKPPRSRLTNDEGSADDGSISLLILGLFVLVMVLIAGAVDVTSAQIARMRLLDTADAIALDVADAVDEDTLYTAGAGGSAVTLTSAAVHDAAVAHLAETPMPHGITAWQILPGTGTPDTQRAVVRLSGTASLPFTGGLLEALGGSVTITVESAATTPLR